MARVPKSRRPPRRHHRVRGRGRRRRHHGRAPQRLHGPARPREQRHPLPPRPGARRRTCIGSEGQGLKIALTTLNTGRLSLPAMCAGAGKWCAEHRPRVVRRAGPVGPPVGEHEAVAQEARLHRRHDLRPGGHARPVLPARRRRPQRHPDRGRAGQALRQRDGAGRSPTSWSRSAAAAATRPPPRWRPAASAAVPVEQMLRDLRINRIFEGSTEIMHLLIAREAVDAAPVGRPATSSTRTPTARPRRRPPPRPAGSTPAGCPRCVGRGQLPGVYGEFGPLASHLRYVERACPQAGPLHVLRHVPLAGRSWSASRASWAGSSTSAPSCSRCPRSAPAPRPTTAAEQEGRGSTSPSWPAPSASRPGCGATTVRRAVVQHRQHGHRGGPAGPRRPVHLAGGRRFDPSAPGRWVAPAEPGPSKHENVHRHAGGPVTR